MNECIDQSRKMPQSITQQQKFFLKGRPKQGGETVLTSLLLLDNKKIEDIILDMKDRIETCNHRISKQRIQHHNVAKLGCIMCLLTKIEMT